MENDSYKKQIDELLLITAQEAASDLHLSPGVRPTIRINNKLVPLSKKDILDPQTLEGLVLTLVGNRKEEFNNNKEIDFSYSLGENIRFRVNAYMTQGLYAAACRFIPNEIKTIEDLNLPDAIKFFSKLSQGFVLVVGPTGHGKSTTLAALINLINRERTEKVITIEDPIEYIFTNDRSIIDQRELHRDTDSFHKSIRSAFRQNVNVIMVGEMRDLETMSAAVTAAETGHLVFASLHTNSAAQTIERIVDSFPHEQHDQILNQLSHTIAGVISQRLIPSINGGLIPAVEVMFANTAIRNLIRENKIQQLNLVIETSHDFGMISLNKSLSDLVKSRNISMNQAEFYSLNPKGLKNIL